MRQLVLLCCVFLLLVPASVAFYGYGYANHGRRLFYQSLFSDGMGDARERMRSAGMFRYPYNSYYRLLGEAAYDA